MSHTPDYSRRFNDMQEAESQTGARHDGNRNALDDLDGNNCFDPTPPKYFKDEAARVRWSELYTRAYDETIMDYEDEFTPEITATFPEGSRIRGLMEGTV